MDTYFNDICVATLQGPWLEFMRLESATSQSGKTLTICIKFLVVTYIPVEMKIKELGMVRILSTMTDSGFEHFMVFCGSDSSVTFAMAKGSRRENIDSVDRTFSRC